MNEIKANGKVLAIHASMKDNFALGTTFLGTTADFIQVGRFRYNAGHILRNHRHIQRIRTVEKTQEVLIVFSGSVRATTFAELGKVVVDVRVISTGEFYISYYGGCGFEVLEDDTRMLEIKPGPFLVTNDNEERELL